MFAQNSILFGDAEVNLQTCNAGDGITVYKYESTNPSYVWESNLCRYINLPSYSFTYNIQGNYNSADYALQVIYDDELPITKGYFGLTKLKITVGSIDDPEKRIFYYDVKDCQFYGRCRYNNRDVTLRYDFTNDILWFKPYKDIDFYYPTQADGWEKVSETTPTTKTFWDIKGLTHCPLDFSRVAPKHTFKF